MRNPSRGIQRRVWHWGQLLPGIMRKVLLDEGRLVEGITHVRDLRDGEQIRCFNSVREVFDVPLVL